MKKVKCYIRGAYGPGNIGDDILMISTYRSLRRVFDTDQIYIGVDNPALAKELLPEAEFLHIKKPFSAEIVVLGGGGQFFSFKPPAMQPENLLSKIVAKIKRQSNLFDTLTRLWIKARGAYDNLYFAESIGAYCIGLGPFESDGKNLERTKKILPNLDYISVRESTSAAFYRDFVNGKQARVYTDPSFNRELWLDRKERRDSDALRDEEKYVSFIVRDWPHSEKGQAFLTAMFDAAAALKKKGHRVRIICLYQERDEHLVARAPEFEWLFWKIDGTSPSAFMSEVCASSKVIISARAHGVMLAAALDMPTIAVEIEPKLNEIHKMLPTGTRLVSDPTADAILSEVESFPQRYPELKRNIIKEYRSLEILSQEAEQDLISWVKSVV